VMLRVERGRVEGSPTSEPIPAIPNQQVRGLVPALAWMLGLLVLVGLGVGIFVGVDGTSPGKPGSTLNGQTSKTSKPSATSTSDARSASTCEPSQLHLASDRSGWHANYGAAGQFTEAFTFSNVSQTTCDLDGWPVLQAMVDGIPQPTRTTMVWQNARPSRVTLGPRATASFDIYGEDWDPVGQGRACGQTTSGFLVTPPNDIGRMVVAAAEPDCGSLFLVAPVIPGSVDLMPWSG
jgi:hypothetical protein